MTIKTMMKRGAVKARTGMRTQDPRLAQHCDLGCAFTELAAKGRRKARLLSARDALQSDPSSQKRGRTMAPSGGRLGAAAPSSQSRRHERKHLHPYYNDVLDVEQLQVSQVDAQSLLCLPPAPSRGTRPYDDHQTACIDYTGEKIVDPASDLPANLEYNIQFVKNPLTIAMTRMILPVGPNVAVCVRNFRHNNNLLFSHEDSCALESAAAATQFAIGRHKAPTDVPSAKLKTQKDGNYAPDIDTDVRDSHKIQEEVKKKEQRTARQLSSSPRGRTVS